MGLLDTGKLKPFRSKEYPFFLKKIHVKIFTTQNTQYLWQICEQIFVQMYTLFSFSFSTAFTADFHKGPFAKSMASHGGTLSVRRGKVLLTKTPRSGYGFVRAS
jgi:hypothetical protein